MTLEDFIELAQEWDQLGWAVQEQLTDSEARTDEEAFEDQNENALKMIATFLRKIEHTIDVSEYQ